MKTELLRIKQINMKGLFGLYDHRIPLQDERVTIIHGPNGVGKTRILMMLADLFSGTAKAFQNLPFDSFEVVMGEGISLTVKPDRPQITVTLEKDNRSYPSEAIVAPEYPPWISRINSDYWVDERDNEFLTNQEFFSRYPNAKTTSPTYLTEIGQAVEIHLIETQRLFRTKPERLGRRQRSLVATTVGEFSKELRLKLQEALAQYASVAQGLDQTFPQRLLSEVPSKPFSADDLKTKMTDLYTSRKRLADLGILDESHQNPFELNSLENLDDSKAQVMSLYVQDTQKKLEVLNHLSERVHLLLQIVNQKFLHKTIAISREQGLLVLDKDQKELSLDHLSSGEQHELILFYDLLFNVKPNTLVLIDEPELSLHLLWQKSFLEDLLKIIQIANFDALIATHSPYIVGDYHRLMVELDSKVKS